VAGAPAQPVIGRLKGRVWPMAEKAEKKAEAAPAGEKKEAARGATAAKPPAAPAAGAPKGGFLTKLPVLIGGVMIVEAVVLFAGFKFLGSGAKSASADLVADISKKGDDGDKSGPADAGKTVEVELLDGKFPNKQNGRTFLYDVHFRLSVKTEAADKVKKIITDRSALIEDRIRTIIAQSDPEKLNGGSEPGLETLKRQVKYQLDEIVGDGLIDEVLVPQCIGFRTDY
jgi:flagellar basal body-associated protein FliL